jgi:hypothetical protein
VVLLLGCEDMLRWEVELGGAVVLVWKLPAESTPWSLMSRELAPI